MDKKHLVTQTRSETDRRRQVIAIAPAGQAIIDENRAHAVRIVKDFKTKIGEEKYEQLIDLLDLFNPHGTK